MNCVSGKRGGKSGHREKTDNRLERRTLMKRIVLLFSISVLAVVILAFVQLAVLQATKVIK